MIDALIHSRIPVLAKVDVLVVGAGSAGCCAAIAAAGELGAERVMLIDRYGFAGGASTGVLDTFYGFFTPGDQPRKVVGGLPDRVVDRLHARTAMHLRPNTYGAGTGITYNPEVLKLVWDQLLIEAGVDVLLHSLLIDAEVDAGGRIIAAVVATRSGPGRIVARRFIDASGDADLCARAGLDFEKAGAIDPAQTLTTTFRLANVNHERFAQAGGKKMLAERMRQADLSIYPLPRREGSFHAMAIPGCAATVAVRVGDVDATDSRQLTAAEIAGRKQAFIYERFVRDCVPGYENARIVGLAVQIGVRETRRVYGEYRLTREDCLAGRRFDDEVLLCGAPIEDHRQNAAGQTETAWAYVPRESVYGVAYRTLIPIGRDEILMAGRCFSATHDAHASCRSMGQTMAMGQAAGLAAGLSLRDDRSVRQVAANELQETLRRGGAVLEMPAGIAATGTGDWTKNRPVGTSPEAGR